MLAIKIISMLFGVAISSVWWAFAMFGEGEQGWILGSLILVTIAFAFTSFLALLNHINDD